ncbi:uncharacterized protein [Miscanthus floridulus]|uniref:uncharacterized protein isoform X2 n=1 Tax=Miscanthus floridulus TaxID=154761 RepID=UPI00345A6889
MDSQPRTREVTGPPTLTSFPTTLVLPRLFSSPLPRQGSMGTPNGTLWSFSIFNGKKLEYIVPLSHNCRCPHVNHTDYQLIDIFEDGFVQTAD